MARERHESDDELDALHELLERDREQFGFFERIGKYPGAALVLIVNFVPALLALWLDWDPFAVVLIYWFENGVIGLLNLLKIAFARPRLRTQADVLVGLEQAGIFELPAVSRELLGKLHRRPADRMPAAKSFALAAFLLTFPVFMVLHAAVLFRLFEGVGLAGLWPALRAALSAGLGAALAALAVGHVQSFVYEFIYRGGYRRTIPILQVARPYPKLIVIHVALLAGALVAQLLPAGAITAVALVLLKTALDLGLVLRIPLKPTALEAMLKAGEDSENVSPAPRTVIRHPGGSLLRTLPRVGIRATSRRFSGLLVAPIMLALCGGVIFGVFGLVPIGMAIAGRLDLFSSLWSFIVPVAGVPLGGLLLAIGLTTLHSAIRAGWTRAEVRVSDGKLEIIERGPLVRRRARCSQEDVDSVQVTKSGIAVNNVPFWYIEVGRNGGRPAFEILFGRPEAELNEVAEQLRAALGLEPREDPEPESATSVERSSGEPVLEPTAPAGIAPHA